MTDNVTRFPFGGHGTGKPYHGGTTDLPTECPDRFKSDNLRPVRLGDEIPPDLAPVDIMDAARRLRELREILEENERSIAHAKSVNARIEALLEEYGG